MSRMFDVMTLQKQLVAAACPSGGEARQIAGVLAQLARPYVDEITTDPMGNLICHKKGAGKRVMLAAHMDAIGLMVTAVDPDGYVWFTNVGGHAPSRLLGARVHFENGVHGVVRLREEDKTLPAGMNRLGMPRLYVDIGATCGEEAARLVRLGDVALFDGAPMEIGGGNIMGPYGDDLIGCVTLLLAMEQTQSSPNDIYYVFTVQEEVGCRGSKTAAFAIAPQLGIAVDVCGTGDTPLGDQVRMEVKLGKGPTIKIKDASVICTPAVNALLAETAAAAGIPVQMEILTGGGTDTSSMQMSGGGAQVSCVSIPTRHIHSPAEVFNRDDVVQAGRLLAALLAKKL